MTLERDQGVTTHPRGHAAQRQSGGLAPPAEPIRQTMRARGAITRGGSSWKQPPSDPRYDVFPALTPRPSAAS
jgi:hypothetical protein